METLDYLILGAGPAGLTFANLLKRKFPKYSFLVLEKEETAGGLCRSMEVDSAALDIGGGHFLDVRRPQVNEFLFTFLPEEEWNIFDRDSRIDMGTYEIGHPFEANIWQMPQEEQVQFLKSIAVAGCNLDAPMPEKFIDWVTWKLGKKIAESYMIPYNRKMFGEELDRLGTYWLNKLPNVSFEETLLGCLNRKPYGTQPGHARFYYPKKYGYGELWERMGKALGDRILYSKSVVKMNLGDGSVTCGDGSVFRAKRIITTIPWRTVKEYENCEPDIIEKIGRLKSTGTEIRYVPEQLDTEAHWIYVPDPGTAHHRILVRHNFCTGSRGYWLETNMDRVRTDGGAFAFANEYTYPLNTTDKPELMREILSFMEQRNVFGLGRWGEHEHYNSDAVVERAMHKFEDIVK